MDRNIITPADAAALNETAANQTALAMPPSPADEIELDEIEKGGGKRRKPAGTHGSQPLHGSAVRPRKADKWEDRLMKFIPLEAVGLYIGIDAALRSAQLQSVMERRIWFGLALVVTLVFTWVYLRIRGKVSRRSQLGASLLAVLVWVFAIGGVFATFAFYRPFQGTVLLIICTAFLSVMPLQPLAKEK